MEEAACSTGTDQGDAGPSGPGIASSSEQQGPLRYLCYFMHRLLDFRVQEVEAVAELCGLQPGSQNWLTWGRPHQDMWESPFWYLTLPSHDAARRIAERCLLVKGLFELWGEGATWEELQASVEALPWERKAPYLAADKCFKVVVDGWGSVIQQPANLDYIDRLAFLPFQGRVQLVDPDVKLWLIVVDHKINNGLPAVPQRMYVAREVALSNRHIIPQYALSKRLYLGPTSMDHEMAFIMCNQAQVRKGQLVYDPFVGTGSIILAAAHYGAHTLGTDIDIRVVRDGKVGSNGEARDIWANFRAYGLPPPLGLLRADAHRPPWRAGLEDVLDAIVCDPPYGVRAGGRKSVPVEGVQIQDLSTHIAPTAPYTLGECLRDLLDTAARLLRPGARLVYFLPATPQDYRDEDVPCHPALELVANSEQILSSRYSRRLITMRKARAYDAAAAQAHHAAQGDPSLAVDTLHGVVYQSRRGADGERVLRSERPANPRPFRGKCV